MKEKLQEKLFKQHKHFEVLLNSEKPDSVEIGQVWQIIPNDKLAEASLGVVIDASDPFTVVMLNNTFKEEEIEGNDSCLINGNESTIAIPLIAVWWIPLKVAIKGELGRFICNLENKVLKRITDAVYNESCEPQTGLGRVFRKKCELQALKLGFPVSLGKCDEEWLTQSIYPNSEQLALAAAPADEKQLIRFRKKFEKILKDCDFFTQCPVQKDQSFFVEFCKDLSLSFFDSTGAIIRTLVTENRRLNFDKDSFDKTLLNFSIIKIF